MSFCDYQDPNFLDGFPDPKSFNPFDGMDEQQLDSTRTDLNARYQKLLQTFPLCRDNCAVLMPKLEHLALKGNAQAALDLAHAYHEGTCGPVDLNQGIYWLRVAKVLDSNEASEHIATLKGQGLDIPYDEPISKRRFTEQKQERDNYAQFFGSC